MDKPMIYVGVMAGALGLLAFTDQWNILSIAMAVLLVNAYWTMHNMNNDLIYHIRALHHRVRVLEQARLKDALDSIDK